MKLLTKTNIDIRSRLTFVETKLFCILDEWCPKKCTIFNVGKKLSYFKESGKGFVYKVNAIWFSVWFVLAMKWKILCLKSFWCVSVCLFITLREKVIIYVFSHEYFKCLSGLCQVISSPVQCFNTGCHGVMLNWNDLFL